MSGLIGRSVLGLMVAVGCLASLSSPAKAALEAKDVETLLSRLNLDFPGLEKVKAAAGQPEVAARELLGYFRGRTSVAHSQVDRRNRAAARGQSATAEDLAVADDALKNILITCPEYPRYDFGQKIDWYTNRDPRKDAEWLVQLHRHYSWTPLGRAYWHTGDEIYAQAYVRQLLDWIEHCPVEETGRKAWGTLEVGIRGHAWTLHWNYFVDSPSYTPEVLVRQMNSFYDHARRLTHNRQFTRNNWGLMEAEGAAFIGLEFPEFKEAATWRRLGIEHLVGQIREQVFDDGMHREMCFNYHRGSIAWLNRTLAMARANGLGDQFPPQYAATIQRMYEVLGQCMHPDGNHSAFGDDRPARVRDLVRQGAKEFPDSTTLAYLAGQRQVRPPPTAVRLATAGLYSLRSGWDDQAVHLILKCGADGGWHCQPDNGTFELYAYGRYLMPDSGCYIYSGDAEGRKWFRQTRVHQTLTLDGRDSAYKARSLLWQTGDALDVLVVENQSYADLAHRRAVFFVDKAYFVVVDEAIGAATGEVEVHFQLAPGKATVESGSLRAFSQMDKQPNVLLQGMPRAGLTLQEEPGQVSLAYSQKEPRPAMSFRQTKTAATAAVRFVTVVFPYRDGRPAVTVSESEPSTPGDPKCSLAVTVDGRTVHLGYDLSAGKAWRK
jgi:heparan-sulfate lyase